MNLAALHELWVRSFSGDGALFRLEGVAVDDRDGKVIFTVRSILWEERDGGELSIRDVKEQECFLGDADDFDDEARNAAAAAAFDVVFAEVSLALSDDDRDASMPADFVPRDLLSLGNCETRQQFEKALRTKKRLGRFLPAL